MDGSRDSGAPHTGWKPVSLATGSWAVVRDDGWCGSWAVPVGAGGAEGVVGPVGVGVVGAEGAHGCLPDVGDAVLGEVAEGLAGEGVLFAGDDGAVGENGHAVVEAEAGLSLGGRH